MSLYYQGAAMNLESAMWATRQSHRRLAAGRPEVGPGLAVAALFTSRPSPELGGLLEPLLLGAAFCWAGLCVLQRTPVINAGTHDR